MKIELSYFDEVIGNEVHVEAEVNYYVDNDSVADEFGTQKLPNYVVVEDVFIDGRDISDEELSTKYQTNRKEIAQYVEDELKKS